MSAIDIETTSCPHGGGSACTKCVQMCEQRPCWPTPDEVTALTLAGFERRLMLDYWVGGFSGDYEDTMIVSPAIVGYESAGAPRHPEGRCTFLTDDGLCELHALGLKPLEGRAASCTEPLTKGLHELIARTWDTDDARALVAQWKQSVGMEIES